LVAKQRVTRKDINRPVKNVRKDVPKTSVPLKSNKSKRIEKERLKRAKQEERATAIVLCVIAIGLITTVIGSLLNYLTNEQIPTTTVELVTVIYDRLETGIVVRNESFYTSNLTGNISFHVNEGERVRRGQNIASVSIIDFPQTLDDYEHLEEDYIQENSLETQTQNTNFRTPFSHEIEQRETSQSINEHMRELALLNVNNFTAELESTLLSYIEIRNSLFLSTESDLSNLSNSDGVLETNIASQIQNNLTAANNGIFTSYIDSFEWLTPVNMYSLTSLQTSMEVTLNRTEEMAYSGDDAFRIINSNDWYIASHIYNERLMNLSLGSNVVLHLKNSYGYFQMINMVVHHLEAAGAEQSFVIFKTRDSVSEFLNKRTVRFRLADVEVTGMKVPREALATRSFLKVPENFTVIHNFVTSLGEEVSYRYIYVQTFENSILPIEIRRVRLLSYRQNNDDGYILIPQETNQINLGYTIINSVGQAYEVYNLITEEGIFRANIGIAEFRPLDLENLVFYRDYAIVSLNNQGRFGLNPHDRIISNAQNILVYEGMAVF